MDPITLCRMIRNNEASAFYIPHSMPPHLLADALTHNTTMTQLVLSGNDYYSLSEFCQILEALSCVESLRALDLSKMELDAEFLTHVTEFVANTPNLQRLDLSHNVFTEEIAWDLGLACRSHPSMKVLILEQVFLEDLGARALLEGMTAHGCGLVRLNVAHNEIGHLLDEFFGEFCEGNTTLENVNTNGNFISNKTMQEAKKCFQRNKDGKKVENLTSALGFLVNFVEPSNDPHAFFPSLKEMHQYLEEDMKGGVPAAK